MTGRAVSESDRDLVSSFIRGRDERAFRLLYRRHTPAMYALALRLSPDEADEIVQDAWIRAAQRLHGFEWRSQLRTWLSSILINCSRELARRRARAPARLPDIMPGVDPRVQQGHRIDLERAIAALPEGYREVFVLYDIEGYSHREIGSLLGIADGTCKSQLSRARRAIRRSLEGGDEHHA